MKGPKRSGTLQRYGHAGEHLRDALLEALEYQHMQHDDWWTHIELDFTDDSHNRWWERLSDKRRARWLLGQLWNCTDALPG